MTVTCTDRVHHAEVHEDEGRGAVLCLGVVKPAG
jgi:hypothetical protein